MSDSRLSLKMAHSPTFPFLRKHRAQDLCRETRPREAPSPQRHTRETANPFDPKSWP
ncbi:uncharacterized protein FTOL_12980 [Fusarium torulosum]|uniref:Uncharacterized protein n=1 Tax=Fusarium torulosum TaxID=33205 RepID=A0AAE8MN04_9HYPO|nr:uncharacterized protein FTOL_12980 [Fusarium torulosum]